MIVESKIRAIEDLSDHTKLQDTFSLLTASGFGLTIQLATIRNYWSGHAPAFGASAVIIGVEHAKPGGTNAYSISVQASFDAGFTEPIEIHTLPIIGPSTWSVPISPGAFRALSLSDAGLWLRTTHTVIGNSAPELRYGAWLAPLGRGHL